MMNNLSLMQNSNYCGDEPKPDETKNEVPSLLPLLPALSAQACPITIIRENSTLTKRISYSENLKERLSFPFERPRLDRYGDEISIYKCQSTFGSVTDSLKETREVSNNEDKIINSIDESLEMELFKQKNSFKECQQIFMKIQRKFSNTSLKKSKPRKVECTPSNNVKLVDRQKLKQKISAAGLFKNEHGTKNYQNSIQCKGCKKHQQDYCSIKIRKKDIIEEQGQAQRDKRNNIQDIYGSKYSSVIKTNQSLKKILQCKKETESDPNNNTDNSVTPELKCVYYSEKQSPNVEDIPGAPPCTPNEVIVNGIASLSDVKSQRNIQQKLRDLRDKHAKREKEILAATKVRAAEQELENKKRSMETQRRQIYAVNKILAEIEYNNFLKSKNQIQGLPV